MLFWKDFENQPHFDQNRNYFLKLIVNFSKTGFYEHATKTQWNFWNKITEM